MTSRSIDIYCSVCGDYLYSVYNMDEVKQTLCDEHLKKEESELEYFIRKQLGDNI